MNRNIITVLTPTYNRAECLKKLYRSLIEQTDQSFEWLVVDDGSTDQTMDMLQGFQKENQIEMRIIRQENGGKHRALNRGIPQVQTPLTFIVDSDDYLPKQAIEIILQYHTAYSKKYDSNTGNMLSEKNLDRYQTNPICGYSFLRCHADGRVNTAYFQHDEQIGTYCNIRINGGIAGDKAEVFYTAVLKQYPFPEFQGERFLPEDIVWMQMSGPYSMVHINENIYICEYQEGGLTRAGHRMKMKSPNGMMLRSRIYLEDPAVHIKIKLKMMLLYIIYAKTAGITERMQKQQISNRCLWYLCLFPAEVVYWKWKGEQDEH